MGIVVVAIAMLVQGSVTVLMYYLRGSTRFELLQYDSVAFLLPAVMGCVLLYKGFSIVFAQPGYTGVKPIILIVSVITSVVVMVVSVAVCVRQLGS